MLAHHITGYPPDHTLRLGQPYDVVTNYFGARLKRINLKCRHLSDARKVAQDQLVGKNGHHPTHLADEYHGKRLPCIHQAHGSRRQDNGAVSLGDMGPSTQLKTQQESAPGLITNVTP